MRYSLTRVLGEKNLSFYKQEYTNIESHFPSIELYRPKLDRLLNEEKNSCFNLDLNPGL